MIFWLVVWSQTLVSLCVLLKPKGSAFARYTWSVLQAAMILVGGFRTPAGRGKGRYTRGSGQFQYCREIVRQGPWRWGYHLCSRERPSTSTPHGMCSYNACHHIRQYNCHHTIYYRSLYSPSIRWGLSLPICSTRQGTLQDRSPGRTSLEVVVRPPCRHQRGLRGATSHLSQHPDGPICLPWQVSRLDYRIRGSPCGHHHGIVFRPPARSSLTCSTSPSCP